LNLREERIVKKNLKKDSTLVRFLPNSVIGEGTAQLLSETFFSLSFANQTIIVEE
jgi:hypothetical protein